ncbi:hypothetical protein [Mycobacterium asiaticum]|uniref:hypothetical protein n=1 Tax=Mycobacterium asiaticum TaxID=1790 RepID=UPI0007F042CA|nr:hypothetical protein [Mycobacterium asiaticum]OBJ62515.1 hypothetical protein A9W94_11880 [Mycobacterium asiaticum]
MTTPEHQRLQTFRANVAEALDISATETDQVILRKLADVCEQLADYQWEHKECEPGVMGR